MTLDSWVIGRLAQELHERLAGARVRALRATSGELVLACFRRGQQRALRASLNPEAPLVAAVDLTNGENGSGPSGWAGGVAALLRGAVVHAVHAVPHDRVINVDLRSRSAFGVPARHRLTLELEPRKANALVLRPIGDEGQDRWSIIAAAKQFEGTQGARGVTVGAPYEPPPRRAAKLTCEKFADAFGAGGGKPATLGRLLGDLDPTCTPPLARDVVARATAGAETPVDPSSLLETWEALRGQVAAKVHDLSAPIFAYRRGDEVVVCHVVELTWPAGELQRRTSVNELCAEQLEAQARRQAAPAAGALRKRLETLLARGDEEQASFNLARRDAADADALRAAGDAIYANLTSIPARASEFTTPQGLRVELDCELSAKDNAARYFRRFKKARSALVHMEARLKTLQERRAAWEQLLWELERAQALRGVEQAEALAEIAEAIGARGGRAPAARKRPARLPPRQPVRLAGGALAYVGRSPRDNERLTFSVASPNDYWFHARGIPGAHVILKLGGRARPTGEQIAQAAALAAGHSRAADAAKVEVDYTQRKHVRRRGKGGTGLVWYTDFESIAVAPQAPRTS